MSKQSLTIGISIIIVAVIGLVVFQSSSQEVDQQSDDNPAATISEDDGVVRTINGLHQYLPEEGRHIVAGTTTVPTPCHQLTTETEVRESNPEQVVLSFAAEKENNEEMCAQVIQNRRFKVSVEASSNAGFVGGSFDGDSIELNLREVGAEENLDDFQVYTKG